MGKGPEPVGDDNAVRQTVRKVGGVLQAAAAARVRYATMHDWNKKGAIRLAAPLFRLAEKAGIKVDPRLKRLAGLKD